MSKKSRWKKARRYEELLKQQENTVDAEVKEEHHEPEHSHSRNLHDARYTGLKGFYFNRYRLLLIIPFLVLALAMIQIGVQTAVTGDFMNKGVSLSGGMTITITSEQELIDSETLLTSLNQKFPQHDIDVKSLSASEVNGLIIEADILEEQEQELNAFLSALETQTGVQRADFTIEIMGSSLGASFFKETFTAILVAFLFMGIVVFIYFRTFIPSVAVILAAFSDIIITVAITNILGIKISTAGIAAFLMLIGYSVDTDILLSTNLLKRKEGSLNERLIRAMKTGLLMTVTTLAAVIVALIVADSPVIEQIMTILLIGLIVDLMNTWIQNVSILKIYLEKNRGEK